MCELLYISKRAIFKFLVMFSVIYIWWGFSFGIAVGAVDIVHMIFISYARERCDQNFSLYLHSCSLSTFWLTKYVYCVLYSVLFGDNDSVQHAFSEPHTFEPILWHVKGFGTILLMYLMRCSIELISSYTRATYGDRTTTK